MKRIFFIFIIVVAAYFIYNFSSFFSQSAQNADVTSKTEEIFIDVGSMNTIIVPEKRNDVEAKLEGRGKVKVKEERDKISIEYDRPVFQWFQFFSNRKLTIYIPEDFNRELAIDLGSGNVNLEGPSKNNPFELEKLSIDMGSGNVNLRNLSVDEFSHDGSSGNIKIDSLKTKTSTIDISSGSVKIKGFTGEFNGDLSSGNMEVEMDELTGNVKIDVSSGRVVLDLPDDADFKLRGKTGSGHISTSFPVEFNHTDGKSLEGVHGKGEYDIDLSVSSGMIKIE